MSRYIDADLLIEKKWPVESEACFYALEDVVSVTDIEEAPNIDIVRCKECRHWCNHKDADYDQSEFTYYCEVHGISLTGNDYCSYGEREGE